MIFLSDGRAKKVPREPTIDGMSVDEFIRRNADPIWLHQEGLWHLIPIEDDDGTEKPEWLRENLEGQRLNPVPEDDEDDLYGDRLTRYDEHGSDYDESFQVPF